MKCPSLYNIINIAYMRKIALLSLLGLAASVYGLRPQDYVMGLPDCDRMNSDWFSGYLSVN